jgi:beta-lactamase superfamily II metal-dependent hydrolase
VLFFVIGVAIVVEMRLGEASRKTLARGLCFAWAVCALAIATFPFRAEWAKGKLEVDVLDVGQGDSLFVVSPGGKTLLIDGGGAFGGFPAREQNFGIDPGEEAVSPYLWSRGFKRLDVVGVNACASGPSRRTHRYPGKFSCRSIMDRP